MNIKQSLAISLKRLAHLDTPKLEAEVLLSAVMKQDRTWLKVHDSAPLNHYQQLKFKYFVWQRSRHIPTAYIIGYKIWGGLKISVNKNVLIPRDETETLCHHIAESYSGRAPLTVLDIGTGSGCVALWCRKKFPGAAVTALDISKPALKVARKNDQKYKTKIKFLHSHLLSKVKNKEHYDLIVANLPYVPSTLKVSPEVDREPDLALFSGDDGLDHLRLLADEIRSKQISFDELWLEFLPEQKDSIKRMFIPHESVYFPDAGGDIYFCKIKPAYSSR